MHLRNVEIFCDVVLRRSFSKAAAAHNVSQSSASQAVNLLEKRLGTELLDRSKRPLEPTAAGKVYFDGCRKLLDSFHQVEEQVQQMNDKVVGRVRVAAIYSVGLSEMDTDLKRYSQRYPDVDVQLDYEHPDDVYARVLNDEAEIGLVSFPRDGGEISCIPWQEQKMVLTVGPDHRLAGLPSTTLDDLDGEDLVSFTPDLTIRKMTDRWLKQSKVTVNIVHEFDNIEHIKRAVEANTGIAILPLPTVQRELDAGSLCSLTLAGVSWYRPLGIVHKRHKTLTTAASKLVDLLHEDPDNQGNNGSTILSRDNTGGLAQEKRAVRRKQPRFVSEANR